jgi:hypothetical protein
MSGSKSATLPPALPLLSTHFPRLTALTLITPVKSPVTDEPAFACRAILRVANAVARARSTAVNMLPHLEYLALDIFVPSCYNGYVTNNKLEFIPQDKLRAVTAKCAKVGVALEVFVLLEEGGDSVYERTHGITMAEEVFNRPSERVCIEEFQSRWKGS